MRTSEPPPRSWRDELERAERFVESRLNAEDVLRVLAVEAGDRFDVRPPAFVVGVETVQAERPLRHDADEYRRVDLERIELEASGYDVILCCNVLEHVPRPLAVLPLLRDGLRTGGLMVIMVPNVFSLKGVLTRLTPLAVHRWYYRRIVGPGSGGEPARSVHSFSLRPASLRKYARKEGLKIEYWRVYEGEVQRSFRHRLGVVGWRWRLVVTLTQVLSFGSITAEGTGLIAILSKVAVSESV